MKKYILTQVIFSIIWLCSCSNGIQLDELNTIPNNSDTIHVSARSCYNCLPTVDVSHDKFYGDFVLEWSGYDTDNRINHPVTIKYNINGQENRLSVLKEYGRICERVNAPYLASWSIECNNPDCRISCTQSGSIRVGGDGESESGSVTDCHKEYLPYSIERAQNDRSSYYLILNDMQGNLYNTEKYMQINAFRTFRVENSVHEQEVTGVVSMDLSSAPYRIKLTFHSQEMTHHFRIHLYNTDCEHNREHYYYSSFYFDGSGPMLSNSMYLINNH